MSGLEFLRLVRTHPRLLTLPVVQVSSDNSRRGVLDAVGAGCSGYLIRPYSLQAFAKQVTGAFAGVSFRAENRDRPWGSPGFRKQRGGGISRRLFFMAMPGPCYWVARAGFFCPMDTYSLDRAIW
jgi:DNA-binding NtrC family response regulator